jgi:hypothetical protein
MSNGVALEWTPEVEVHIARLQERFGKCNKAELFRIALATLDLLEKEVGKDGELCIIKPDGSIKGVTFVFRGINRCQDSTTNCA